MKILVLFGGLLLYCVPCFSQTDYSRIADSIQSEGLKLYFSEKASWEGTDLFRAQFPALQTRYGGYFSYTARDTTWCVIISNDEPACKLATFVFSNGKTRPSSIDTYAGVLNQEEQVYLALKIAAITSIRADTFFHSYQRTILNIVPIIDEQGKRVYVLTGTDASGVVILGNDYLMRYSAEDSLLSRDCLHRNIMAIPYKSDSSEVSAFHTHFSPTSEFMTVTDYCTLLLYSKLTTWKQHYVITKDAVSILNVADGELMILSRGVFDQIYGNKKP